MRNKKILAIDITINNKVFRYATRKIHLRKLTEEDSCNGDVYRDLNYKPYLTAGEGFTSEIEFEGEPSTPTNKISVWDASTELRMAFNSFFERADNYEEALVTLYIVKEDRNQESPFLVEQSLVGYMTDTEYKQGVLSFTVRAKNEDDSKRFMKIFNYDTFQTFEILPIYDLDLGGEFTIKENTPWRVFKSQYTSTRIRGTQYFSHSGILFPARTDDSGTVFPDFDRIVLNTTTNQYKRVVFNNSLDVDTGLDYFGDPNERRLIYQDTNLFPNPNGAYYGIAILGNDEDQLCERIAYGYCLKGKVFVPSIPAIVDVDPPDENNYYLSGIPTDFEPDPLGLGSVPGYGTITAFKDALKIKYIHQAYERVAPVGFFDKIYVIANGLLPNDYDDDPELSVGFVHASRELKANDDVSYKVFHRYEISGVFTDIYDEELGEGTVHPFILELSIHTRKPDPGHVYYANIPFGNWSIKSDLKYGDPVNLVNYNYIMKSMDLNFLNTSDEILSDLIASEDVQNELKDRYRGKRVDMLKDFADFIQTVAKVESFTNGADYNKTNNNLLNNATGLFAVCNGSEIIVEGNYAFERLYFYSTQEQQTFRNTVPVEEVDDDSYEADVNVSAVDKLDNKLFANYFTYSIKPINKESQEGQFDSFREAAKNYFASQRYRIVHDPVPENSDSLGKFFPIVYGNVYRVPLIHVISNKTFMDKSSTAGDDFYVFASHPTYVKDPSNIIIELFDESVNEETKNIDAKNYSAAIKQEIIISPFPNYQDNHFVFKPNGLEFSGRIFSPYFRIQEIVSLDKDKFYGIKLRGFEWDYRAGPFDKRYPIRNGVGSSPLYGTYSGWIDQNGSITGKPFSLVSHPVDIIKHFLSTYGKYPNDETTLDMVNLENIKSETRKYEASIFLNESLQTDDFIEKICLQFSIFSFKYGDRRRFSLAKTELVDYSKPISEGLNLLNNVEEESEGYKDIYTEIIYNYRKNYVKDNFDRVVRLDSSNNEYCARASKANGGKKTFTIDADFVASDLVANEVAQRYAYYLCSRRFVYKIKVRNIEGITFIPGDRIPFTYFPFNFVEEPVTVMSVKDEMNGITEIKLVRFV